jgi:hypothetical protein
MDNKIIKEVPSEIIIIDSPIDDTSENQNPIPTTIQEALYGTGETVEQKYEEVQKRTYNTLKGQKIAQTRKGRSQYQKSVQRATQALLDGNYCTLEDGGVISGAEIIAMNLFQRAVHSDESARLLLKVSGDLDGKETGEKSSYEEFIKDVSASF